MTDPQPVRVGDLSAHLIEEAGEARQTLALTHDRQLIGIVIPVTQRLVHFLIEQNLSSIQHNIAVGEKELSEPDAMTTLGEVTGQNADSADRISST